MTAPHAQRLLAAIRGDPTDRVPRFELFWHHPEFVEHTLGRPSRSFEDVIAFAHAMEWGSVTCAGFGWFPGTHESVASDGTRHYDGGLLKTRADLETLPEPDIEPALEELAGQLDQVHASGLLGHFWVSHCFHAIATSMGLEHFALTCYDDFDFVAACMERVEAHSRRGLAAMLDAGLRPDLVCFDGDCAYKTGLMVSPEMYRRLVFEPTARTVQILREAGIPYLFHTDGKVDDVYPVLIELGFSGAHGVEAQANDLAEIKRRFGDRLTLFGNMDPVFLTRATPAEIARETERMVQVGMPGGRYVAAVNTIVREYVPIENYEAFIRTVDRVGVYPAA